MKFFHFATPTAVFLAASVFSQVAQAESKILQLTEVQEPNSSMENLPTVDALGVRIGMTPDEVSRTLTALDPRFKIENISKNVTVPYQLRDMGVISSQWDAYPASIYADIGGRGNSIVVQFTHDTTGSKAFYIRRVLAFPQDRQLDRMQAIETLEKKFGATHQPIVLNSQQSGGAISFNGGEIDQSDVFSNSCAQSRNLMNNLLSGGNVPVDESFLRQFLDAGCDGTIHFVFSRGSTDQRVADVTIHIFDMKLAVSAGRILDDLLRQLIEDSESILATGTLSTDDL